MLVFFIGRVRKRMSAVMTHGDFVYLFGNTKAIHTRVLLITLFQLTLFFLTHHTCKLKNCFETNPTERLVVIHQDKQNECYFMAINEAMKQSSWENVTF